MSAIGAISAGHLLRTAANFKLTSSLENFRKSIGARLCHFLAVEKALEQAGTAAAQSYVTLGYRPVSVSSFWLAGAHTALLPLQLTHQTEGVLDTQVLVLSRTSSGDWRPCGALSGFHLEAVAEAMPELQAHSFDTDELRKLILPKDVQGKPFEKGWAHATELGNFGISIQINAGQTTVEAAVTRAGKAIWHKIFSSSHSLRCAYGLPA